jgi:hypothetical protein
VLADRLDPSVGGAPVEALAVTASQDRPLAAFTDSRVDRRCGEPAVLHPGAEQLDVRTARGHDGDAVVGGPLEEAAQVVAVRHERTAVVAGKERDRSSKLRLIDVELEP